MRKVASQARQEEKPEKEICVPDVFVDAFISEGKKVRVGRGNTIPLDASAYPMRNLNGGESLPYYPQLRLGGLFHYLQPHFHYWLWVAWEGRWLWVTFLPSSVANPEGSENLRAVCQFHKKHLGEKVLDSQGNHRKDGMIKY